MMECRCQSVAALLFSAVASGGCQLDEVIQFEVVTFPVDAHLMHFSPSRIGIIGVGDIVRGRQTPLAAAIHQESDVLNVIVLIAGDHVKNGSPRPNQFN